MTKLKNLTAKNDFVHVRLHEDATGRSTPVLRAVCQHCAAFGDIKIAGGSVTCEQAFADKMFRNKKWALGNDRQHDTCPGCVSKQNEARRLARLDAVAKKHEAAQGDGLWSEIDELRAAIKKQPSVADSTKAQMVKYLMYAKDWTPEMLSLVKGQIDGAKMVMTTGLVGYATGWSDARIARELGVMPEFHGLDGKTISAVRVALYGAARRGVRAAPVAAPAVEAAAPVAAPAAALPMTEDSAKTTRDGRILAVEARLRGLEDRLADVEDREDELRGVVLKLTQNIGSPSTGRLIAAFNKAIEELERKG